MEENPRVPRGTEATPEVQWSHPFTWIFMAFCLFIVWVIVAAFWAVIAWSSVSNDTHEYMLSDYFNEAGFDITAEHPVAIGGNIEGTSGSVEGSIRMFFGTGSGSVSGDFSPTSSVKMLLPLVDGSNILMAIPANQIIYHTQGVEEAHISFEFEDYVFSAPSLDHSYAPGDGFLLFSKPTADEDQPEVQDTPEWTLFNELPLDAQLLDSVERIDLYLTEAQLNSILN